MKEILEEVKGRDWFNLMVCCLNSSDEKPIKRSVKGHIEMPNWVHFDETERALWKLDQNVEKIEENFSYLLEISVIYCGYLDFFAEYEKRQPEDYMSVNALKIAISRSNEYLKFLKNQFFHDRWLDITKKNNMFDIGVAQNIWNDNHIKHYELRAKVKKEVSKGKKPNLARYE